MNQTIRLAIVVAGILGAMYITATHFDESEWKSLAMIAGILVGNKLDERLAIIARVKNAIMGQPPPGAVLVPESMKPPTLTTDSFDDARRETVSGE